MTEKSPVSNKKVSADWFLHGALTRIGDTLDRFTGRRWAPSSSLATSELIERLKRLLDAEVRDVPGKGAVVPHNLRLLVQWDKFSTDGEEGLSKLENELLTAAADHINDNLYYTLSPLKLEVKQDYFVEGVKLSASFDSFAEAEHDAQMNVTLPSINMAGVIPVQIPTASATRRVYIARFALKGEPRDRRFEVSAGNRISIGRSGSNQLAIDDVSVSKMHAAIVADAEGNLSVADTGSTNGTFINGERIAYGKAVQIGEGVRVRFGSIDVVFDLIETIDEGPTGEPTVESAPDGVTIDGIQFSGRSSSIAVDAPTPLIGVEDTLKVPATRDEKD
jgi:pSer/pThr/pTyr-binding forkhead associated (FHA) protein